MRVQLLLFFESNCDLDTPGTVGSCRDGKESAAWVLSPLCCACGKGKVEDRSQAAN